MILRWIFNDLVEQEYPLSVRNVALWNFVQNKYWNSVYWDHKARMDNWNSESTARFESLGKHRRSWTVHSVNLKSNFSFFSRTKFPFFRCGCLGRLAFISTILRRQYVIQRHLRRIAKTVRHAERQVRTKTKVEQDCVRFECGTGTNERARRVVPVSGTVSARVTKIGLDLPTVPSVF